MARYEKNYIECAKCGHPYFTEEHKVSLAKEPVRFQDDYESVEARVTKRICIYKCASCGEILDRMAAAKKAEEGTPDNIVIRKSFPDIQP
jgi:DNA-directed RNA polymerase subunit RPC12/RpoP